MKRFNGKYNGFAIELKFANIEMQYVLSFYYKKVVWASIVLG